MATEPERSIEKLLRDCAGKRRKEAGQSFELHPATRRLLQGEVAGQYGSQKPEPSAFSWPRLKLWPHLAWGLVSVMVLAVGAGLVLPRLTRSHRAMTLAKQECLQPSRSAEPVRPRSPSPAASPGGQMRWNAPLESRDAAESMAKESSPTSPAPMVADEKKGQPMLLGSAVPKPESPVKDSYGPATNAAYFAAPAAQTNANQEKPFAQQFVQVAPPASAALDSAAERPAQQQLLACFQAEQSGQQLKVIDQDGSVYSGYLQVAEISDGVRRSESSQAAAPRALRAAADRSKASPSPAAGPVPQTGEQVSFRVAGTNRTLQQPIIFTGSLIRLTNAISAGAPGKAGVNRNFPAAAALPVNESDKQWLQNTRISGKVLLGDGTEVRIEARPRMP